MRKVNISNLLLAFIIMMGLTSCELAGDIFEAGAWTAIILVVLVIAIVVWIIKKIIS